MECYGVKWNSKQRYYYLHDCRCNLIKLFQTNSARSALIARQCRLFKLTHKSTRVNSTNVSTRASNILAQTYFCKYVYTYMSCKHVE